MKTIFIYIIIVLQGLFSQIKSEYSKEKDFGLLRFDGLYYKQGVQKPGYDSRGNYTYLRFYKDGTVLRVATASKPEQAIKWFNQNKAVGRGHFRVHDNTISFDLKYGNNILTHEGTIMQDTLRLTVYGSAASNQFEDDYYFVKVSMPEEVTTK